MDVGSTSIDLQSVLVGLRTSGQLGHLNSLLSFHFHRSSFAIFSSISPEQLPFFPSFGLVGGGRSHYRIIGFAFLNFLIIRSSVSIAGVKL